MINENHNKRRIQTIPELYDANKWYINNDGQLMRRKIRTKRKLLRSQRNIVEPWNPLGLPVIIIE